MASNTKVSLFLNSVDTQPILIDCVGRFAIINPRQYGGCSNSELFATISNPEGDFLAQVHDGVSIENEFHFVLDCTLANKFLLVVRAKGESSKNPVTNDNFNDSVISPTSKNLPNEVLISSDSEDVISINSENNKEKENFASPLEMDELKQENVSNNPVESTTMDQQSTLESILLSGYKYHSLSKMITTSTVIQQVEEIPQHYNGDCVFELPPIQTESSSMKGMEQKYDGHCWIKPVQTRMSFPAVIRRSKCGGHLQCKNTTCPMNALSGKPNEIAWTGKLLHKIPTNGMTASYSGKLLCFHCGKSPVLVMECPCVVYYVLAEGNMTRLFIHRGTHNHPVAKGVLRVAIQKTRDLVSRLVTEAPQSGPRHMQLNIAKQMVMGAVIREDGKSLESNELLSILEEMRPLVYTHRYICIIELNHFLFGKM